jgi:hypothetical protein
VAATQQLRSTLWHLVGGYALKCASTRARHLASTAFWRWRVGACEGRGEGREGEVGEERKMAVQEAVAAALLQV